MSFLVPAAFWLFAAAPVVVLLYLLKQKRRPAGVSTLMFWQRVVSESKRRVLFRRLRQWLSLLLHLLILALLALAVAKPEWGDKTEAASVTVIVVDSRARMQASAGEPGGASRFQEALDGAKQVARRATPANPVVIVAAARTPFVAVPLTGDEQTLTDGLKKLQCSDGGGHLDDAVRLGLGLLASRPGGKQIIVFSDERKSALLEGVDLKETVASLQTVGRPVDNIGITRLAVRPLLNSPQTCEILLELSNNNREAAWEGQVEFYSEDRLFDVRPVKLAAGARSVEIYPAAPAASAFANARGWLTARINVQDALPLDNAAYAAIPSAEPKRILLVSKGNLFLENLLRAEPSWRFDLLSPDAFNPAQAEAFDVVIFDGAPPASFDLATAPGGFFFIGSNPLEPDAAEMQNPVITGMEKESPLLRLARLEEVTILKAQQWSAPEADENWSLKTVVQSLERPLILQGESKSGSRFVAMAFHPLDSDLPMRVAYPLLVSNIVSWLGDRQERIPQALSAGQFTEIPPDAKVWNQVQTKQQTIGAIPPDQWVSEGFQPERNGFYLARFPDRDSWLAVNTGAAAMSDLRNTGLTDAAPARGESQLGWMRQFASTWKVAASGQWPPWVYLALAAFILFSLEWGWFHRRKTE